MIIPRYALRNAEEVDVLARMEQAVLVAYREAFPNADLHWLDCDPWIEFFGAVHCITHTVPDWDALQ